MDVQPVPVDEEQRKQAEDLRHTYQRRLVLLEKERAVYGGRTDPSVLIEIEDIEQKIAAIDRSLGRPTAPPLAAQPFAPLPTTRFTFPIITLVSVVVLLAVAGGVYFYTQNNQPFSSTGSTQDGSTSSGESQDSQTSSNSTHEAKSSGNADQEPTVAPAAPPPEQAQTVAQLEQELDTVNIKLGGAADLEVVRSNIATPSTGYAMLGRACVALLGNNRAKQPLYLDQLDDWYTFLSGLPYYSGKNAEADHDQIVELGSTPERYLVDGGIGQERLREAMVHMWNKYYGEDVSDFEQIIEPR